MSVVQKLRHFKIRKSQFFVVYRLRKLLGRNYITNISENMFKNAFGKFKNPLYHFNNGKNDT